jgi:hypothetical protein
MQSRRVSGAIALLMPRPIIACDLPDPDEPHHESSSSTAVTDELGNTGLTMTSGAEDPGVNPQPNDTTLPRDNPGSTTGSDQGPQAPCNPGDLHQGILGVSESPPPKCRPTRPGT